MPKNLIIETPTLPVVHAYHFDMRDQSYEANNGIPETNVQANVIVVRTKDNETELKVTLQFIIVSQTNVISGLMSQDIMVKNRVTKDSTEFNAKEVTQLTKQMIDMLKRLAYDTTEVVFDKPGLDLSLLFKS